MKKTNLIMAVMLLATAALTTSCFNDDDSIDDNDYTVYTYCTVVGSNPNYKLYMDGGGIAVPSTESVASVTGNAGFGSNNRFYLILTYKSYNCTTASPAEVQINQATIQSGAAIPVRDIMTKSEADADSVTVKDSVYTVSALDNVWAYRGYLTTLVTGTYVQKDGSITYPQINVVYNPEDVSENAIKFHIYYNVCMAEGKSMSGYTYTFPTSYPISNLANIVPGSGDITMTFEADGIETTPSIIVSRSSLTPPTE